jgi:hypothetical protein
VHIKLYEIGQITPEVVLKGGFADVAIHAGWI